MNPRDTRKQSVQVVAISHIAKANICSPKDPRDTKKQSMKAVAISHMQK